MRHFYPPILVKQRSNFRVGLSTAADALPQHSHSSDPLQAVAEQPTSFGPDNADRATTIAAAIPTTANRQQATNSGHF
jgi:hypothetical protein